MFLKGVSTKPTEALEIPYQNCYFVKLNQNNIG